MIGHTPGPWVVVSDLPDYGVATENQPDFHPDPVITLNRKYRAPWRKNLGCSQADAERIVACVNACDGLANPGAIPEVMAALKSTLKWLVDQQAPQCELIKLAMRDAINKVEGHR